MSHPLDSVVFISIGEGHTFSNQLSMFDPSIPLPVQLTQPLESVNESNTADGGKLVPESLLTRESILAGILTVLAYDHENAQLDYYRSIILSLYPSIRSEMTEAAIMKIKNGDFELAEELFFALKGLDPEDMFTVLNLALLNDERANSMRQAGLDEEAEVFDAHAFEFYKIAMSAEPPLPEAFFNAGFFYLKQKNYKKTREALSTYLTLETADSQTAHIRKEKATQIVNEISNRDLDDDLFKAAYDYISMGEEEKALEQLRLFMETHPDVWNAWFLLGWALRRLARWEDARSAFMQALELGKKPNSLIEDGYTDICNELSICLMELGDFSGSKKWLYSALENEGDNTKIISNLGMLALKEGNKIEAEGFFRTVLEIDPKDRLAQELLTQIESQS